MQGEGNAAKYNGFDPNHNYEDNTPRGKKHFCEYTNA